MRPRAGPDHPHQGSCPWSATRGSQARGAALPRQRPVRDLASVAKMSFPRQSLRICPESAGSLPPWFGSSQPSAPSSPALRRSRRFHPSALAAPPTEEESGSSTSNNMSSVFGGHTSPRRLRISAILTAEPYRDVPGAPANRRIFDELPAGCQHVLDRIGQLYAVEEVLVKRTSRPRRGLHQLPPRARHRGDRHLHDAHPLRRAHPNLA